MSEAGGLTPTEYIGHHLTNRIVSLGDSPFWTLHLDTFLTAVALGFVSLRPPAEDTVPGRPRPAGHRRPAPAFTHRGQVLHSYISPERLGVSRSGLGSGLTFLHFWRRRARGGQVSSRRRPVR